MPDGPGRDELKIEDRADTLKVAEIVGHKNHAGFAARRRNQNVVTERLGNLRQFQTMLAAEVPKHVSRSAPGTHRRRYDPAASKERIENVAFQFSQVASFRIAKGE